MSAMADKIRAARTIEIKVGAITFTGTRATPEDFSMAQGKSDAEFIRARITNWEGVKESDLIKGGSKELVPFDKDTFDEIIGEKIEWYTEIAPKLFEDAAKKFEERKAHTKK